MRSVRLQQFLCKIQSAAGTFETLAAADGRIRINEGSAVDYQPDIIDRTRVRASFTPMGHLVGKKPLGMNVKSEMNTPDTITSALEEAALLEAAGIQITQARRIPIGAFTGGPPVRGATITGGTSGAIGRLLAPPAWTTGYSLYAPVSGTFASGEVLSYSGGATATSSAVSAAWGWFGLPKTPTAIVSGRFEEDGKFWSLRDAAVSMGFEIEGSGLGQWDWNLLGARHLIGEAPLTAGVSYDLELPQLLQDADLVIGASFKPVISKVSFNLGGKLVTRDDGNAAGDTGIKGGRFGDREPKLKITIESPDNADFDVYSTFDAATTVPLRMRLGREMGKTLGVFVDQWQPGVPSLSGDDIRMMEIEGDCTHTTDDREVEFVWF